MRKGARRLAETVDSSVQIRCRYCDIKDTCVKRVTKEAFEDKGLITRCTITPNRPTKKRKKK